MTAMRGIIKWTIRREGRIGRVWRRRGTGAAKPESETGRTGAVISYGSNQAKDRRMIRRSGRDRCEAESM